MNREEAAEKLGISVRSLQRAVKAGRLSVRYRRGESGKQEAFFDADEIERYKREMESETVLPAHAPMGDTGDNRLARVDAPQFANALMRWLEEKQASQEDARDNGRHPAPVVAIENKPLLKLDEASALTGLSRGILRDAIQAGKLKAKIIGRSWRVKREDLDSYIKKL